MDLLEATSWTGGAVMDHDKAIGSGSDHAPDHSVEESRARMAANRSALLAQLSEEFKQREDALPQFVAVANASVKTKLGRIYALLDEFSAIRAPHVACRSGCADCCRMNVQINAVEAAHIERETRIKPVKLDASIAHPLSKFNGVPCPFLRDNRCTIYHARPAACRHHASFDVDAYWCAPERSDSIQAHLVNLGGAMGAVSALAAQQEALTADIRGFYPGAQE